MAAEPAHLGGGPVAGKVTGSPHLAPDHQVRRRRSLLASLARYLVTLFVVVTLIFLLPRTLPGDPLEVLVGEGAPLAPEVRARLAAEYGLDQPLVEQYRHYLARLARGDLGTSITAGPVRALIGAHLPWTLLLMGTSVLLAAVISFRAGIASAWSRGRRGHNRLMVLMTGLEAVPEYALAPVILILFAAVIPLFPSSGARTPFATYSNPLASIGDVVVHLVLPVTALTISLMGAKFLVVRSTAASALGDDYMLLARAKGLPERLLRYRHAGRNALLPFITVVAAELGLAVRGAVVVETVFAYPGMAGLILPSAQSLDYPLLEGCFLVLAVLVLTANLIVEMVYGFLDPRVGAE